jgi:hypothetical protein
MSPFLLKQDGLGPMTIEVPQGVIVGSVSQDHEDPMRTAGTIANGATIFQKVQ